MVGFIKTWGTALICAAIIGSICNLLLPKHAIAKVAKILIGVYLAIVIVSPLLKAETVLPDSIAFEADQSYTADLYDDAVLKRTAENIELQIGQQLEQSGVVCDSVSVAVTLNETGGIYCAEVTLGLDRSYQAQEQQIKTTVTAFCGTTPVFMYRD